MITIAFIRETQSITDADVADVVAALQIQVDRDFLPNYPMDAVSLIICGKGGAPSGAWQQILLDNADQAGDLGYHLDDDEGLPLGKIFVAEDLKYGLPWSLTASHEVLEMLADPYINKMSANGAVNYPFEVCDATEDQSIDYLINGIAVSNFVFPSWFIVGSPGPYDFRGKVTKPFELTPGGYAQVYQGGKWTSIWGSAPQRICARAKRLTGVK